MDDQLDGLWAGISILDAPKAAPKPVETGALAGLWDGFMEDKPDPPESQKRAETLGRQHADEIFAGKFKTRTGVPIVDETILGNDGTERQAIPRKVWWGNAPPTPGDPAAGKPQPGRRGVDDFINKHVNLGDLRDQNPQFDEPAYRREMAKRYNELYGGKVAGDLAEQDKTPGGKVFRALDYVTERLPTTGTIMPNREQRIRAAGAGLVTGEANARDIEDSILYAQEQEAAKNRGVGGMVLETLSRAPAFIAEVETLGGLAGATAIAGGARAAQNYASGETALEAAKGFGREAVTNAAFGAIGAAPGLNVAKRAAARAEAGTPTTLGTLARDWAVDTPKVVAASNLGQEVAYQAGLNPEGAPEGSAVKRALQGDQHAKKELLAEVLGMGILEGGTRARSALGILRNGPIQPPKPPEIAQEPVQTPTPAVEPVVAPKPAEAKIEPPTPKTPDVAAQPGRFLDLQQAVEAAGDVRPIYDQVSQHEKAGGEIVLHAYGKEIPVKLGEGNQLVDATGQKWGLLSAAMSNGRLEFRGQPPVERPTEPTAQNGRATSDLPPTEPTAPAQTATAPDGEIIPARNASQQEIRARAGLAEIEKIPAADLAQVMADAKIKYDPEAADALAQSVLKEPRVGTIEQQAKLRLRTHELDRLTDQANRAFDEAAARGEPSSRLQELIDLAEQTSKKADDATRALELMGKKWSDFGRARQKERAEDFTAAGFDRELRKDAIKYGKPLTPAMREEARQMANKLAEGEAAIEAMKNPTPESIIEQAAAESNNATKKPLGQSKAPKVSWTEERIKGLEAKAAESSKKLKDILSRLNSGVDPEIVVHLSNIALAKIARGSYNAAKFTADIVKEFGEKARKYAGQAWEAAVQQASEKVEKATAKAKDKIAAGELDPGLTKLLRDVLRGITQRRISAGENVKGTEAREAIVGEVHSLFPEIDRPTLEDAISGIGKFRPLSKDEVSVAVRDIQGQLQQLGKLRYLAKGEMPPRTGTEKRDPSVTELDLQKQYKDLLRESGIEATSPEQLRSTKDAIKARYQHDIESMDRQIAEGEKLDRTRAKPLSDPEIDALKAKRAEKKAEYDAIFGDPTVSPEAQAEKLITSLNKQVNAIKAQIESGNIYPDSTAADAARAKRADLASTQPGVADAIDRLNKLREMRDVLRNADVPRLIEERLATLQKQKADLERRKATWDVMPKEKKQLEDPRIEQQMFENDMIRAEMRAMRRNLQPKSGYEIASDIINSPRPILMGTEASPTLIQAGPLLAYLSLTNPKAAFKSVVDSFRAMSGEKALWQAQREIWEGPDALMYKKSGVHLTTMDTPFTQREEAFISRLAMNIPVLGRGLRGLERYAVTILNTSRANALKSLVESAGGKDKVKPEQLKDFGNWVNVLSGRGPLGPLEGAVPLANAFYNAARFNVSLVQAAVGQPLWKPVMRGDFKSAGHITMAYLKAATGIMALQGLVTLVYGDEWVMDPKNPMFLKGRTGDTYFAVHPIFSLLSFGYRNLPWVQEKTSPLHGGKKDLTGEKFGADFGDELASFHRKKLAPVPQAIYSLRVGKDPVGKKYELADAALSMVYPYTQKDVTEVAQKESLGKAAAMAPMAFFGMSINTIKPDEEDIRKHIPNLTDLKPKRKALEGQDAYEARVAKWAEEKRQAEVVAKKGNATFEQAKELLIAQWQKTGRSTALYRDGKPTELKNRIDRLKTLLP